MITGKMTTIPEFLIRRLNEHGVTEGFGIVGDYALRLFDRLDHHGFPIRVTADEQGAGFAADAYARLRGLGVCGVTYSVGGLKVVNATAGAWAENVPLLIISGAPGMKEREGDPLLHHKIKNFDTQLEVFKDITIAQAVLNNPLTAAQEIDRVISKILSEQRPGYIEIPRDMVDLPILDSDTALEITLPKVDPIKLKLAVAETLKAIKDPGDALIVAGVTVWRRGLQKEVLQFSEMHEIPIATTSLSRGVMSERHPLSVGVYMGAVSPLPVVKKVESAKPLITFGVPYADLVMGGFTDQIDRARLIECTDTLVRVGYHVYEEVPLWAFLPALIDAANKSKHKEHGRGIPASPSFTPKIDQALSVESIMACVSAAIDERHGLLIEPGDCLFASVDLTTTSWVLSSAFYASMGYAIPAALGAGKAKPLSRPVVLVGDGAFLMTGLESLHAVFHGIKPIVIVVDNKGYGTQRPMIDGPFNNIPLLRSELLLVAFGTGVGKLCENEEQFQEAITEAIANDDLYIIRACVPQGTHSAALTRLTDALRKKV